MALLYEGYCLFWGYTNLNAYGDRLEHQEMKTIPVEQLASFLRESKDSGVFEMYYIELATGLRRGDSSG